MLRVFLAILQSLNLLPIVLTNGTTRLSKLALPFFIGSAFVFSSLSHAAVDLVKVDKSKRRMYLLDNQVVVAEFQIALGKSPKGHKQQEGDQKTPEGRYILDYIKTDSAFHLSIHISYPNNSDKQQAKQRGVDPGGMIMIHGQKNWHPDFAPIAQQFDWTDGCIAITNDEMQLFAEMVKLGTPIEIEW
ncbi:L,D-transpeptidase family protein [Vibrio tapetis]|uniref:L,D-TPase catalytic domain-containing protein n=1 Tax=Vibrio tapetis subsp. tapetis TaxID=1671868 RepID=A0A2N8ZIY1_9VIBR|nr:L,D-transpeptidase family protein [Vibrio tapetis]SON51874.1 conserved exported protein of unknown function [Vibrio tapetis subsp. tapetis]